MSKEIYKDGRQNQGFKWKEAKRMQAVAKCLEATDNGIEVNGVIEYRKVSSLPETGIEGEIVHYVNKGHVVDNPVVGETYNFEFSNARYLAAGSPFMSLSNWLIASAITVTDTNMELVTNTVGGGSSLGIGYMLGNPTTLGVQVSTEGKGSGYSYTTLTSSTPNGAYVKGTLTYSSISGSSEAQSFLLSCLGTPACDCGLYIYHNGEWRQVAPFTDSEVTALKGLIA